MVATRLGTIALLLCAWLIYEPVTDLHASERAKVLACLENEGSASSEQDHDQILRKAQITPLWQPPVKKKHRRSRPEPKPNLKRMIRGLRVVSVVRAANNKIQVTIRDARKRSQDVYRKGDKRSER